MAIHTRLLRLVGAVTVAIAAPVAAIAFVWSHHGPPYNAYNYLYAVGPGAGAAALLFLPYDMSRRLRIVTVYVLGVPLVLGAGFLILMGVGCRLTGVCP